MKHIRIIRGTLTALAASIAISCSESFLDFTPKGIVTLSALESVAKTEELVIGAYASLGNTDYTNNWSSDYVWGSVRSDDAYKGGGSVADQGNLNLLEQYNLVTPAVGGYQLNTWNGVYAAIARINHALRNLDMFTDAEYPLRKVRQGEMRFLRGHFMFILKRIFKYPVFLEHTVVGDDIRSVSNDVYTNDQLWDKIAEDFQFAIDNLPPVQTQKGRANRWAATAYLAKVRLYQAYVQNETHSVVSIDQAKLQQVVTLTDAVTGSGQYSLVDNYGKKWTFGYENNSESIFAIQFSFDDGTTWGRVDFEHGLNYNMASVYGCCSFHNPSNNLVNAFKTDMVTGLPLFDTFNNTSMLVAADFDAPNNSVDPRLNHTLGVPGHPFKYDPGFVVQNSWSRTPAIYGNFVPMKELQHPNCNCIRKASAFFGTAQNWDIIQYNDVLLMKAEALIELGDFVSALPIINQIRTRASNKTWLTYPVGHAKAGQTYANYNVQNYPSFPNQDYARKALQWERRMEFAMESPRFHDLVRWGIAAETLNAYIAVEKTRGHAYLNNAFFTKGRDEYLPIPQDVINLVDGLYKQLPGYSN